MTLTDIRPRPARLPGAKQRRAAAETIRNIASRIPASSRGHSVCGRCLVHWSDDGPCWSCGGSATAHHRSRFSALQALLFAVRPGSEP